MEEIIYFPGCTLKTTAKALEASALRVAKALGMEVKEMPRWYCCGTVYSLAQDDLIKQLASIRNLIEVQNLGHHRVMTLCSMCYNTLAQSNLWVRRDEKKLEKINQFISEQPDYKAEIEVRHFLTFLKDIGTEKIKEEVKNGLSGLKVACYYGCLLLRPREVGLDNSEQPTILEELMEALGATPVYFPYQTECCGSYHTAVKPEIVARRAYRILENARENGAELLVTSCPLCYFNLKDRQREIKKIYPDFKKIEVRYFTEIMSEALGV